MKKSILNELISTVFENENYISSKLRNETDKVIFEELDKIEKITPREIYSKIEDKITHSQTISEECGFCLGLKFGILLMCELYFSV